jgi:hypothetical protein
MHHHHLDHVDATRGHQLWAVPLRRYLSNRPTVSQHRMSVLSTDARVHGAGAQTRAGVHPHYHQPEPNHPPLPPSNESGASGSCGCALRRLLSYQARCDAASLPSTPSSSSRVIRCYPAPPAPASGPWRPPPQGRIRRRVEAE